MRTLSICTVLAFVLLTGCSGSLYIQRSLNHIEQAKPIMRIACLDPTFMYANGSETSAFIESIQSNKSRFIEYLQHAATQNEIELKIIDTEEISERDVEYFNTLAPLRRHLMAMNFLQRPIGNPDNKSNTNLEPNGHYVSRLPIIDPEFAHISERLGTPFVASQILLVENRKGKKPRKGESMFLNIIVNVETGETVFREIREVRGFPGDTRLSAILYDSFRTLNYTRKPPKEKNK